MKSQGWLTNSKSSRTMKNRPLLHLFSFHAVFGALASCERVMIADSLNLKQGREQGRQNKFRTCQALYEWVDFIGDLNGQSYTGVSQIGLIASVSTPLFDNERLLGSPVANLRGSVILDQRNMFATGTLSFHFYKTNDMLTFHQGFAVADDASSAQNYGIPVGGNGSWAKFEGFIYNARLTDSFATPAIVNYTICSDA